VRPGTGSDAGFVGGADGLLVGVLVFVTGALLLVNLWSVLDADVAVSAAAREAARAYVLAPDSTAASERARLAAMDVLAAHGRRGPEAIAIVGEFTRCGRITVTVTTKVPGVSLGWIGGIGGRVVTGRASELVDPYRSAPGLPEGTGCGP